MQYHGKATVSSEGLCSRAPFEKPWSRYLFIMSFVLMRSCTLNRATNKALGRWRCMRNSPVHVISNTCLA